MRLITKVAGKVPHRWLLSVAQLQYRYPWVKPVFELMANRVRNQDGEIQQGVGRGLRFNTGKSIAGYLLGTAEPDMQAALKILLQPGMTVYDLGANVGFISMIAAHLVGSKGRVISFEPLPANARQIKYNASLNNFSHIVVREEAISDAEGEALFQTTDFPTTGRLENGHLHQEKSGEVPVRVRALDVVIAEARLPLPDLIKMDVEGAETGVLKGAVKTLATRRPIMLIELHGTNEPVARLLEEQNYKAHVLGSNAQILDVHWNSHVVAVPNERTDLSPLVKALTAPQLTG
jgi:FkbM family methyltransferase